MSYYYNHPPSIRAALSGSYINKVLGYGPIAYWPLDEVAGTVAACLVNAAQNGTYARDVATMTTGAGPAGGTAPLFTHTSDDGVNAYTTALRDAFNQDEGALAIWLKVYNVGVWTDSLWHMSFTAHFTNNHVYTLGRNGVNNAARSLHNDGSSVNIDLTGSSETGWIHTACTWSKAANEFKLYIDGAQHGATQSGIGSLGTLSEARIGRWKAAASNDWHGWLAHPIVFDSALPAASILALATV